MADTPTEKEELTQLAETIEQLQRAVNTAGRRRGLKGDEFHPLNILDVGLFNLLIQAKIAAGMLPNEKKEEP